jgi:hypothetical protein
MGGLLTGEAEALFGDLGFGRVRFRPVDPDIRACIGTNVARPTHVKFTLAPAAFMEMAAGLPDLQPLPVIELPGDASLLGRAALLEEALEKLAESTARQHHLHL